MSLLMIVKIGKYMKINIKLKDLWKNVIYDTPTGGKISYKYPWYVVAIPMVKKHLIRMIKTLWKYWDRNLNEKQTRISKNWNNKYYCFFLKSFWNWIPTNTEKNSNNALNIVNKVAVY